MLVILLWIFLFIFIAAFIILIVVYWRKQYPNQSQNNQNNQNQNNPNNPYTNGNSGASGSTGTLPVVFFTGPTGPEGSLPFSGASGVSGVTGPRGPTGFMFIQQQSGILDESVIVAIQSNTVRTWYLVLLDSRTDKSTPTTLAGDMTNHLILWDPTRTFSPFQQWFDYGPWLGRTGPRGIDGATGSIGQTGPSIAGTTGPTGLNGPTGISVPGKDSPLNPGFAFGNGIDGDFGTDGVPYRFTLRRDMNFKTLYVPVGSILNTNNYAIFVSRQLSCDGTILCEGSNGNRAFSYTGGATGGAPINPGGLGGGGAGTGGIAQANAGGAGRGFGISAFAGDPSLFAMKTSGNNINGLYTGAGLPQTNLYGGGDASNSFPLGSITGGGPGGAVTAMSSLGAVNILNTVSWPVVFPAELRPYPVSGGAGGGSGFSLNSNIVAASGGGGGGVIYIAAAEFYSSTGQNVGTLSVRGGNAGANQTVFDSSGGGGGGGLIMVHTTTPRSQWGIANFLTNGGNPSNQPLGPGSPVNTPQAIGQPGQLIVF